MVCSLGKNTQETVIQTFQNLNLIGDPLSGNYPVHNTEEFDQANWELSANLFQSQNLMGTFWVRTGNQAMFNRALAQLADVVAARQSDGNEQYTNGYTPPVTPMELVGGSLPDGTTSSKERMDWYKRLGLEMLISEAGNHETSESLLRGGGFSTEALDLAAFGVSNQTVTTMMPGELSIKWKDDMLNPPEQQRVSGLSKKGWAETVDLTQPIDVSFDGKKFYIEDGHHRYYAAKILGKPLNVNLEITASPIPAISKLGYDQFHRSIFDQTKQRKSLPPSDKNVNLQNGKEQNSRTGTSTGDTGQVRYNGTDAIGERGRSESEKDASRKGAKEKLRSPETNASLKAANAYNRSVGLPEVRSHEYKPSDKELQPKIGETYSQLQDVTSPNYKESELERQIFESHRSKYPELFAQKRILSYKDLVLTAYAELVKETNAQFESLPITVSFHDGDQNYETSTEMLDDVHNFGHLWVFKGGDDHTLLGSKTADADGTTANDKFRAVHDYFGHSIEGYQFGKDGEENAWIEHSKMFSPLAQIALTSETRGQNSFVNYSGVNDVPLEKMKTAAAMRKKGMAEGNPEMVAAAKALLDEANSEFQFADQKSLALPAEFTDVTQYFGRPAQEPERISAPGLPSVTIPPAYKYPCA